MTHFRDQRPNKILDSQKSRTGIGATRVVCSYLLAAERHLTSGGQTQVAKC